MNKKDWILVATIATVAGIMSGIDCGYKVGLAFTGVFGIMAILRAVLNNLIYSKKT
jgi:hypothetical protein